MSTDYMNSISVVFYDGVVSKPHQAQLSAVDMNSILISYREQNDLRKKTFKLQQMNFIGALGKKCPVIEPSLTEAYIPHSLQQPSVPFSSSYETAIPDLSGQQDRFLFSV